MGQGGRCQIPIGKAHLYSGGRGRRGWKMHQEVKFPRLAKPNWHRRTRAELCLDSHKDPEF